MLILGSWFWAVYLFLQQHYTVRTLTVMAECTCNGQQIDCSQSNITGTFECVCGNNTQGVNCESCLPFFNQYAYQSSTMCQRMYRSLQSSSSLSLLHYIAVTLLHYQWWHDLMQQDFCNTHLIERLNGYLTFTYLKHYDVWWTNNFKYIFENCKDLWLQWTPEFDWLIDINSILEYQLL